VFQVFSQVNDTRLKARLASAAAATVITCLMLVSVSLGFPGLASASALSGHPIQEAGTVTTAKMEFAS
jgi:hypothetical protein